MAVFVYIDETGTPVLDDPDQPVLTLVAALVREDQVQPLAYSLRQVAMSSLGWLPADFEFHGEQIFNGGRYWADVEPVRRVAAYTAGLELLERHDVSVAHASINKPRLKSRRPDPDSPYLLALQFLCEKVNAFRSQELKVLVADEAKEHELRAIKMVADLQEWGSGVVPGPRLPTLIDTLHFVRSHASPGVQMADLVGYVLQRRRRRRESNPATERAMQKLAGLITAATVTWREEWPRD